jgi:GNAT superfamily N-acetyltransferase
VTGTVAIRQTIAADIPLLAAIERSAAELFLATDRAWVAAEAPTGAGEHRAAIEVGLHWLALNAGAPVGLVFGEAVDDSLYIAELSVARGHQRRGIGRRLVEEVEGHARERGCTWLSLTTYRDLAWNAPFYRRLGFIEPEALPAHLDDHLREEAARGHARDLRCGMVKPLA